ncbi:hypothetical protein CK203_048347 [Vitis vinifera]|uniref:Uncharacterized protein n=1 Tax=Vitis vinifera TaxID=29760 RepID=A0A438HRE4_VITVI|nr:hypothetical protein CK203_048347 [Vitis vinifera]
MAKTRGAKSSSLSGHLRAPRETSVQGSMPEPPRPLVVPPSVEDAPLSPLSRRYETRRPPTTPGASSSRPKKSASRPPKKKARVSEPIDLSEPSLEPPPKPQSSQPPATESQIPSGMTPKPLSDFSPSSGTPSICCRDGRHGILGARHIAEALRIPYEPARPEDYRVCTHPSQSEIVHILSRGVSTRQYLLRKELPPSMFFIDALLRHNIFPLQHWVQRRGILLEALFRISEGFFFGPHHLIMVALLYFEEKVHRKKLLRADAIPLLFPRLLCQILEHLGYPSEPQLERRRICREIFTLDKWTSMTAYSAEQGALAGAEHPDIPHPEQLEEPQPVQIPAEMRAPTPAVPSIESIPEVVPSAPPATPRTPPVIPFISEPPPSSEPRIAISISEYRGLCHTLQALATSQSILTQQMTALHTHQEQIIATQT